LAPGLDDGIMMKLSRKDFLLLLGIAIAAIVLFTATVYGDINFRQSDSRTFQKPLHTITDLPSGFLEKAIDQINFE